MSQIYYVGPRLDFMVKNGKLFVISFLVNKMIYSSFHRMRTKTGIIILRHRSLLIDVRSD